MKNFSGSSSNRRKAFRRFIRFGLSDGSLSLRVTGSSAKGFRLAVLDDKNHLKPFGKPHARQADAVSFGYEKFEKTPKKLTAKDIDKRGIAVLS